MNHNIPISATFTLFKYINVTPSISYTERWYTRKIMREYDTTKRQLTISPGDTIYGFHRVYNYSASLGLSTKLYGFYKPLFMKSKDITIRHVFTRPSVSVRRLTSGLPITDIGRNISMPMATSNITHLMRNNLSVCPDEANKEPSTSICPTISKRNIRRRTTPSRKSVSSMNSVRACRTIWQRRRSHGVTSACVCVEVGRVTPSI
jgi:hypothetical protein